MNFMTNRFGGFFMPKAHMKDDLATAAAKAAPPVAVVGAEKIFNLTLNEWVAIGTLVYLALQTCVLIRNEFIKKRRK